MNPESLIIAREAVELPPNSVGRETFLPDELMWMPAGTHRINASSSNGKPVNIVVIVDEAAAARVQASFLELTRLANAGIGDRVYFDTNHDDKEASAWPSGFRWAGADPVTGGIRARVEWSSAGRAAVLGRNYRRFSPSFFADTSGQVTGIPVNAGGIVNRAAFVTIQPLLPSGNSAPVQATVMAKAALLAHSSGISEGEALLAMFRDDPDLYQRYEHELLGAPLRARKTAPVDEHANDPFIVSARVIAAEKRVDLATAYDIQARENPRSYSEYCAALQERDLPPLKPSAIYDPRAQHPFVIAAKALAHRQHVDADQAATILARQSPSFYEAYRCSVVGIEVGAESFAEPELIVRAREEAKRSHTDFADAIEIVARAHPKLYDAFRVEL